MKIELEDWQLQNLRDYFGNNDRTQTEHWAFKLFDDALKYKNNQTQEEKKKAFFEKAEKNKKNFELHKELIAKNIGGWNTDKMRNSSIEHFWQTGKPSESFLLALMQYAEDYANHTQAGWV